MLTGSGMNNLWSHDRVHAFFSRRAWDPYLIGRLLAAAVVERLVPTGTIAVAVDDTLFRRSGKHVFISSLSPAVLDV